MSKGVVLTLGDDEVPRVTRVAQSRAALDDVPGAFGSSWIRGFGAHLQQAGAELAVATWLGIPWRSAEVFDDGTGDIAGYHVRWTDGQYLPVFDADPDDAIIIDVGGTLPSFELRGWIRAAEGRLKGVRAATRPAGI